MTNTVVAMTNTVANLDEARRIDEARGIEAVRHFQAARGRYPGMVDAYQRARVEITADDRSNETTAQEQTARDITSSVPVIETSACQFEIPACQFEIPAYQFESPEPEPGYLDDFVAEMEAVSGPVDEAMLDEMAARYFT